MSAPRVVVVVVVVAAAACLVNPIDLDGRKCDEEHPCVDGYTCNDELFCEKDDQDSGASD